MPLYEYRCNDCENRFSEVLTVKEHDKREMHCPKCKSDNVKPVIEGFVPTGSKERNYPRSLSDIRDQKLEGG